MKYRTFLFILPFVLLISCQNKFSRLSLHPYNPHYFLFRGKPAILAGSTEHYGAVMNLDFDYIRYLDELSAKSLNVTWTFSGVYVEPQGTFGIAKNTLAPANDKFICPWARSNQPGGGGATLRNQLKILKNLFGEFDYIHMEPSNYLLKNSPEGNTTFRILAEEGKKYLIYLNNSKTKNGTNPESDSGNGQTFEISIELPAGNYKGEWIDTESGLRATFTVSDHKGGQCNFKTPPVGEDLALKLTR